MPAFNFVELRDLHNSGSFYFLLIRTVNGRYLGTQKIQTDKMILCLLICWIRAMP